MTKAEALIERLIEQGAPTEQLTPGIRNVMAKKLETKTSCPDCGFAIPRYPGRYPSLCPHCERPLEAAGVSKSELPIEASDYVTAWGTKVSDPRRTRDER